MVILDTSVIIKWFIPEEDSEKARALLKRDDLGAPDFVLYEFTNYVSLQKALSLDEAHSLLSLLYKAQIQFFTHVQKGFQRCIDLTRTFHIAGYDASFIALAESLRADFITADEKLHRKVKPLPYVRLLKEFS